ncbi:MAG: 3-deoxy-8-phosphooctulonate synthase [Deltaproteobacteria bacterium]|nr:3-deoxy-8-phosphooctulonate synthase [Deltaproteobacteria bacterium]
MSWTVGQPVRVGAAVELGRDAPLALIAGPCVVEGRDFTVDLAGRLHEICKERRLPFVFKASYDKANRSSLTSVRGPGIRDGLAILAAVRSAIEVPVTTDVHLPEEVRDAAEVVDLLQIPAFLCRQTDLLVEAARTGRPVNVKKGQFVAPEDMENVVRKLTASGAGGVALTERGTSFGYHMLVNDMRGLPIMRGMGVPVVFDATHSVQLPGGLGHASGGQREFVEPLARAAVAVGVDALFLEVHPDPERAPSDGPNAVRLVDLPRLLDRVLAIDRAARAAA